MNERMYDELIIAPLVIADIEAACALHDGEPEPRAELLWHLHTPYARVLKAVMDGRFVGYACAIVFEDSGWVREITSNLLSMALVLAAFWCNAY
ncbi:MAG: hypothetical protein IPG10_06155 [Flavobacteriales bacterium]|nr:hypothetical protein [Flavobacteriales bacterium]